MKIGAGLASDGAGVGVADWVQVLFGLCWGWLFSTMGAAANGRLSAVRLARRGAVSFRIGAAAGFAAGRAAFSISSEKRLSVAGWAMNGSSDRASSSWMVIRRG